MTARPMPLKVGPMMFRAICDEAAARIEALTAEVERLNKRLDLWEPKPYCPPSVSSSARSLSRPEGEGR